jgi:integrase
MASIRRRGDKWHAEVYHHGQRRGASFRTKKAAEDWARQTKEELAGGIGSSLTCRQVFDRYLREVTPGKRSARHETFRIRALMLNDWMGLPVGDVRPGHIEDWMRERREQVSDGTALREFNILSAVFQHAARIWRFIPGAPTAAVRRPSSPKARNRLISDDEVRMVVEALTYREGDPPASIAHFMACAFLLALETAMRQGEIVGLTWDRIHLDERWLYLDRTKNGHDREVPLSSRALQILSWLPQDGRPFPIDQASGEATFRKLVKPLGLGITFHDTRGTACTRLARVLSPLELAKVTGHRDLNLLLNTYYRQTGRSLAGKLA